MTSSRTTEGTTIRLARETDPPLTSRVFAAALNELYRRRSVRLVVGDDSRRGLHEHLLRHDPQRFWIAERKGTVVGFSVGIDRGAWWFLAALFVRPEAQGAGVGSQLLAYAMAGRPLPGGVAAAISSALQPASNTLYGRRGLLPWLPLVTFAGTPLRVSRPALGSLEVTALTVDDVAVVTQIDLVATGVARSIDHRWYLGRGGRRGWLFVRAGRPAGYIYVSQEGAIGPAAAVRASDMEPLRAWALAEAAAPDPSQLPPDEASSNGHAPRSANRASVASSPALRPVSAIVPGPCVAAQRVFWEAGLVFGEDPGLLLASQPFGRFDRYCCGSFGLM